jgi:FHA domain
MSKGKSAAEGKITGRLIIDQLVRNMELGQFEMNYSILLPCIFSLYLHPDDYTRLSGILDLIKEDAKRALAARLEQLNARPLGLSVVLPSKERKVYKIAGRDWAFEFFPDSEGVVPLGDVEIHSELNETPQPGYHGVKTTLMGREPTAGTTTGQPHVETRQTSAGPHAEIRYEDDSGPQLYLMTQDEISVGRGGDDVPVNLALYTNDEVSREHLRIRHDAAQGRFLIVDKSMNGTWLNGKRLTRGTEEAFSGSAEIGIAEVITLYFEAK